MIGADGMTIVKAVMFLNEVGDGVMVIQFGDDASVEYFIMMLDEMIENGNEDNLAYIYYGEGVVAYGIEGYV